MFPFNKAKKVLLISYLPNIPAALQVGDTTNTEAKNHVIKKWNIHLEDFNKRYLVMEEVKLNEAWVNMLSHTLVNYTLKKYPGESYKVRNSGCYEPRNSILYLDENDTVICCLEICFTCHVSIMIPDPDDLNKYADVENCH